MDQMKFEKLVYEIAHCWGVNDRDLDIEYSLLQDFGCVNILAKIIIPRNDEFSWLDFWGDVSNHVSKEFDVIIFVEHKRDRKRKVIKHE